MSALLPAARSEKGERYRLPSLRRFLTLEIAVHGSRLILTELALASVSYAVAGLWLLWRAVGQLSGLRLDGEHCLALGGAGFFLWVALNELALLAYALLIVIQRRQRGQAPLEQPGSQQALLQLALLSLLPLALPLLIGREERLRAARSSVSLSGREDKVTTLQESSGGPGAGSC
jgi:heme exporter protein D